MTTKTIYFMVIYVGMLVYIVYKLYLHVVCAQVGFNVK